MLLLGAQYPTGCLRLCTRLLLMACENLRTDSCSVVVNCNVTHAGGNCRLERHLLLLRHTLELADCCQTKPVACLVRCWLLSGHPNRCVCVLALGWCCFGQQAVTRTATQTGGLQQLLAVVCEKLIEVHAATQRCTPCSLCLPGVGLTACLYFDLLRSTCTVVTASWQLPRVLLLSTADLFRNCGTASLRQPLLFGTVWTARAL